MSVLSSDDKNSNPVASDSSIKESGDDRQIALPEIPVAKKNEVSEISISSAEEKRKSIDRLSAAGILISIGIVFGDIGTSPLYTLQGIVRGQPISKLIALGGVSAIFWTLFFQTTLKYVLITLRADNKGEGGIFALYTLIRKYRKWLLFPAIAGGSFLLADSIITPPISVSSAIEGLLPLYPHLPTIPIIIAILIFLFLLQRAGTSFIGNLFGPVMIVWFTMIGILGFVAIEQHPAVLEALNPIYAFRMLHDQPNGFWLLGAVFLCTTGAEALYSDMGHVGRRNIQVSWIYIKITLVLSYFGQSAWLMNHLGERIGDKSPFFALAPPWFLFTCIIIATLATVIASQALISGSFTLINEAIRLNLFPKLRIVFPSNERGQLYIPAINYLLMSGCIAAVLYFKKSENMEAAFGLSVTLTMLMTTVLLSFYLYVNKTPWYLVLLLFLIYVSIEGSFLIANLAKFTKGGWMTLLVGSVIAIIMYVWKKAIDLQGELNEMVELAPLIPVFQDLSKDLEVPKYVSNLVYLTASPDRDSIEKHIIHSVFYRQPKRADIYWFVNVEVVDEPYLMSYKVDCIAPDDVIHVSFKLGFRIVPRINLFFRIVVEDMAINKEISAESPYSSLLKNNISTDFRFVLINTFLSVTNALTPFQKIIMNTYFSIKKFSLVPDKQYGLDYSDTVIENAPLVISRAKDVNLVREY